MIDSFKEYHPVVNFLFFLFVIGFNMFVLNPILQIISLIIGMAYKYILSEGNISKKYIGYFLLILLFSPIFNALFNNQGATMLFYLKNGNPVTLESMVYGLSSGLMFVNMLVWFSCYNEIITSDKFMHLFSNIAPSLSLIISMILRFVPRYMDRAKIIFNSQKAMGEEFENEGIIKKGKSSMKIISMLTTWALENSIDTSDSMTARGYGIGKRTGFSNFILTKRDKIILIIFAILIGIVFFGTFTGELEMIFFPNIIFKSISLNNIFIYISFLILTGLPIILSLVEEIRWHYLELKI